MPLGTGFDPHATAAAARRRPKGSRYRLLLGAAAALGLGAIAVEHLIDGWWGEPRPERPDIIQTRAEPPPFQLPPQPVAFAPPPPPPPPPTRAAEPEQARPRAAPRLPQRVAFPVQAGEAPDMAWFRDGRRPMLAPGCALRPGASTINAALLTVIQSEIAGQAIAEVTEDVYDPDGHGRVLIPAGSRVVGRYKAAGQMGFQRRRVDFVWGELVTPDGRQFEVGDAHGMDASGSMGVGGTVRTRWGELLATAALLTVFDAVAVGTSRTAAAGEEIADALAGAAGRQGGRLGRDVTNRVLDWEPTISIPSGTRIVISPAKTIQVC